MKVKTPCTNTYQHLLLSLCKRTRVLLTNSSMWFLFVAIFPGVACAAEFGAGINEQVTRNSALSTGLQGGYIVQVLFSLVLVVGVIVLLSFLLRKFNFQTRAGSGVVRILSVVPLGGKDKLLLVEVGKEQILLGSSPGNVQKIHQLDMPVDMTATSDSNSEQRNFMTVLHSAIRGQNK